MLGGMRKDRLILGALLVGGCASAPPPMPIGDTYVEAWKQSPPTSVSGKLYGADGQLVTQPATVEVKVVDDREATIYDQTVDVSAGAYRLDGVPEPATTTITATVKGWTPRTRTYAEGDIQEQWAGFPAAYGPDHDKHNGEPLLYDFGGPALSGEDPFAPGYFLALDLSVPEYATAEVSGDVYDQAGNVVPDSAGVEVFADTADGKFQHVVAVKDGAYHVIGAPAGVPLLLEAYTGLPKQSVARRLAVLVPLAVLGHGNIMNFGGPASPDDPDAPVHPLPSPSPMDDLPRPSPL